MNRTFEEVFYDAAEFSMKAFPEATAISTLSKLTEEVQEVMIEIAFQGNDGNLLTEYADCFLCLVDSIRRSGFTCEELIMEMYRKTQKNKTRSWIKNPDNTYSHTEIAADDDDDDEDESIDHSICVYCGDEGVEITPEADICHSCGYIYS